MANSIQGDIRLTYIAEKKTFELATFHKGQWNVAKNLVSRNIYKNNPAYTLLSLTDDTAYYRKQTGAQQSEAHAVHEEARQRDDTSPTQQKKKSRYTNTITINGRIGTDIKTVEKGHSFRLGHWQPGERPTLWVTVLCFDPGLLTVVSTLQKGQEVIVSGRLVYEEYQDGSSLSIMATAIEK